MDTTSAPMNGTVSVATSCWPHVVTWVLRGHADATSIQPTHGLRATVALSYSFHIFIEQMIPYYRSKDSLRSDMKGAAQFGREMRCEQCPLSPYCNEQGDSLVAQTRDLPGISNRTVGRKSTVGGVAENRVANIAEPDSFVVLRCFCCFRVFIVVASRVRTSCRKESRIHRRHR